MAQKSGTLTQEASEASMEFVVVGPGGTSESLSESFDPEIAHYQTLLGAALLEAKRLSGGTGQAARIVLLRPCKLRIDGEASVEFQAVEVLCEIRHSETGPTVQHLAAPCDLPALKENLNLMLNRRAWELADAKRKYCATSRHKTRRHPEAEAVETHLLLDVLSEEEML